ncbi:glycoside hydrolase family 16 protein [Irpex rosettiformis]|uniref:Glycoside hydrolase family 16 protein n=1 Tax=Irpex rosettiformis TaxID=378272 RepID=A0ACB8UK58_9APHY|nr:glycoside hydrolase family 16 protein [Irpex rosettiformis]
MSHFPPSPSSTNLLASADNDSPITPRSIRSSASNASLRTTDSRYAAIGDGSGSPIPSSISDKFAMSPDPAAWGGNLLPNNREPDDDLHTPDPRRDRKHDQGGTIFTARGISNLGCLAFLFAGITMLFGGYPLISHFMKHKQSTLGGFNLGGTNASGQVPEMIGQFGLIDPDTPQEVYTFTDYIQGKQWDLVFSDEFNVDGRTFYPGDDPYWEAVDLHYWQTNNMEWYDPAALVTKNGSLHITLTKKQTHGMDFEGGMMSTWNKFCFTGGLLQVSVVLPGVNNILGLWPAVWAMGNLGRAGYGASLDGMWPYTYDACDVGTVANQTVNSLPLAATQNGDPTHDGSLSYLVGQRLSRCTCQGESHPGPIHADGTYVGRAAPEIDVFEATISGEPLSGQVSQSSQWAPFNAQYKWLNTTANLIIPNETSTYLNEYAGAVYQQATSSLTYTNPEAYELSGNVFEIYGMQYQAGFDNAYIGWIANGKLAWQLKQPGLDTDQAVEISSRPVPQEPMYIIINLGLSKNFGFVDVDHLTFPTTMKVDWVRVYQDPDRKNIGCDPEDFPTKAYIEQYIEAYSNSNLTTWVDDYHQQMPKNRFLGQC